MSFAAYRGCRRHGHRGIGTAALATVSTRRDHILAASLHDLERDGGLVQPSSSRPRAAPAPGSRVSHVEISGHGACLFAAGARRLCLPRRSRRSARDAARLPRRAAVGPRQRDRLQPAHRQCPRRALWRDPASFLRARPDAAQDQPAGDAGRADADLHRRARIRAATRSRSATTSTATMPAATGATAAASRATRTCRCCTCGRASTMSRSMSASGVLGGERRPQSIASASRSIRPAGRLMASVALLSNPRSTGNQVAAAAGPRLLRPAQGHLPL